MASSFERVYTFAIQHCPQLAPKNTYAIQTWLATGYDVELDIIPAIEQSVKHGALTIQSFNYFTGRIRSNNERRVKEQAKPVERSSAEKDEQRAAKIRWVRDKGLAVAHVSEQDFRWLQQYEERNKTGQ